MAGILSRIGGFILKSFGPAIFGTAIKWARPYLEQGMDAVHDFVSNLPIIGPRVAKWQGYQDFKNMIFNNGAQLIEDKVGPGVIAVANGKNPGQALKEGIEQGLGITLNPDMLGQRDGIQKIPVARPERYANLDKYAYRQNAQQAPMEINNNG